MVAAVAGVSIMSFLLCLSLTSYVGRYGGGGRGGGRGGGGGGYGGGGYGGGGYGGGGGRDRW